MEKKCSVETEKKHLESNEMDNNLSNNYLLMMNDIIKTNNKDIYFLAPSIVKNNIAFVKFVVDYFKTDIDFIIEVANEYISSNPSKSQEIIELMYNIMLKNEVTSSNKKNKWMDSLYNKVMSNSMVKMNFLSIQYTYKKTPFLIDHFARLMIKDIFNNISLDEKIHSDFKNCIEFESCGIGKYIFSIISEYDDSLCSYVKNKLYMIYDIETKIRDLRTKWKEHETKYYQLKIQIYELEIQKFIKDKKLNVDSLIVIYHSVSKFHLNIIFNKYDSLDKAISDVYGKIDDINYDQLSKSEMEALDFSDLLIRTMFITEIENLIVQEENPKKLKKE